MARQSTGDTGKTGKTTFSLFCSSQLSRRDRTFFLLTFLLKYNLCIAPCTPISNYSRNSSSSMNFCIRVPLGDANQITIQNISNMLEVSPQLPCRQRPSRVTAIPASLTKDQLYPFRNLLLESHVPILCTWLLSLNEMPSSTSLLHLLTVYVVVA